MNNTEIATMIICCLVYLIVNFIVVMLAMIAALKVFMEAWHEHTK